MIWRIISVPMALLCFGLTGWYTVHPDPYVAVGSFVAGCFYVYMYVTETKRWKNRVR